MTDTEVIQHIKKLKKFNLEAMEGPPEAMEGVLQWMAERMEAPNTKKRLLTDIADARAAYSSYLAKLYQRFEKYAGNDVKFKLACYGLRKGAQKDAGTNKQG